MSKEFALLEPLVVMLVEPLVVMLVLGLLAGYVTPVADISGN